MRSRGCAAGRVGLDRTHRVPMSPTMLTNAHLCHPMIARAPFTREGWVFELKHDGFRALARKDGTTVQLLSRTGRSMTSAFPEVVRALAQLPGDVVLDGELVVPTGEGRSDFEELRRRALRCSRTFESFGRTVT